MENIENGFKYNGVWIENPYMSECGRFEVNPIAYYGLTEKELYEIGKKMDTDFFYCVPIAWK